MKYKKFLVQLLIYKSIRKYIVMSEENISQEFRLKNIDEINQNEVMGKKHEKV